MRRRLAVWVLALVCLGGIRAHADQPAPRDIWPQATAAIDAGDVDAAKKKTTELTEVGKSYGIKAYPLYAESAAALARQANKRGNKAVADWGNQTADQLDPNSAAVAFTKAEAASDQQNWAKAIPAALRGYASIFKEYRARTLSRSDSLIVILMALTLTGVIFALVLFIRYGRAMAHDFREMLSARMGGGTVTVLAVALLFLPLFLWLGPMWLLFYWFIIFFSYAGAVERILILTFALIIASAPVVLDLTAHWIAGVDGPVVMSAIASEEQSYYPEALKRLQELATLVPDSATIHLLLGNLQQQDGNEPDAAAHYRKSIELRDNAGAHVNLGNLHFLEGDLAAAINEYQRAEQLDPHLAIAFYNHSVASGSFNKFDEQAQKLDQAKRIDRAAIERITSNPPTPPAPIVVMYHPPISEAWTVSSSIAKRGVARTQFGNYSFFDIFTSAQNPITLGGVIAAVFAPAIFLKRRRAGLAGSCIKCGRTFCHRCKSGRESATYCTQCIHIYLKRDGVSVATKRSKLEEVGQHQTGMMRRNRFFATLLPGSAQLLEGRTIAGFIGLFLFFLAVCLAILVGHLAPVLAPGELAKMIVRVLAIATAVVTWFLFTVPIYRRRVTA
ncbi:MAG TPA: tetratricopeptide repeat protein [Thermoanaerobaculia bacterium]|nr:tetratricopeptide repeat protein [Thermoanaerobaculia bacterium]